jgi:AraC family transcriptional regulator
VTQVLGLFQGRFGRVSLVDSDCDLALHAHAQVHVSIKLSGRDSWTRVGDTLNPLTDDSLVLINAWEPHANAWESGWGIARTHEMRTTAMILFIEPAWLAELDPRLDVAGMKGFFPRASAPVSPAVRAAAETLAGRMLDQSFDAGRERRVEAALAELMMLLVAEHSACRDRNGIVLGTHRRSRDARVSRAILLMGEVLENRITMDEVATLSNLSRPHFFHLFKHCTGVPPAMYLNALRMDSAVRELSAGRRSINDLADALGFAEPNNFTRFFRKNVGFSPSEYRRRVELVSPARV